MELHRSAIDHSHTGQQLIVAHALLAGVLFLLVNWLGSHSVGFGYKQLTVSPTADEAPAFNFVFRIGAPLVGLSLYTAGLYAIGADSVVANIYLVAVYYVLIRIGFIVATGRAALVNWSAHLSVSAVIVGASWLLYENILRHRQSVLPDLDTIANEFWLLVVLFIFQVGNRYQSSTEGTERRKVRYIRSIYNNLRRRYGRLLDSLPTFELQSLAYSIAINESFNRPRLYRWLERNVLFPLGRSRTLGVMQVTTTRRITDFDSVRLGVAKIASDYELEMSELRGEYPEIPDDQLAEAALHAITAAYNRDNDYVSEVGRIYDIVHSRVHERPVDPLPAPAS